MTGTEKWNRVPELFGRVSGTRFLCPALVQTLPFPDIRRKTDEVVYVLQFEPRIYELRVADARIQILYPVSFMTTQPRFARGEGHPTKSKPQTTLHASVYTFGEGVSLIYRR